MSKLEQLIKELCPNGVEYKQLWELTTWDKNFNNVEKYKQPQTIKYHHKLATELKQLMVENGDIKVLFTGATDQGYTNESLSAGIISEGEIVAIPWGGTPWVQYHKGKFITGDNRIATSNDTSILNNKFLYYILVNRTDEIGSFYRGAGIKHPSMSHVLNMIIPIPPLPIQEKIVHILDSFTELTAELTAELTLRKKQFDFYRDELLNFGDEVEWKTLDKISTNLDAKRKPITSSKREKGKYPYYGASGIIDYVSNYIFDGEYLLISEDGANLVARTAPIAFSARGRVWVNNHAHILEFNTYVERKYIEYYFNNIDLSKYLSTAAQPKLTQENLNKIPIPIPPLSEQERIVSILDRFDALVNGISIGLPAEIEARQKQYEYYRNKLLDFTPLA